MTKAVLEFVKTGQPVSLLTKWYLPPGDRWEVPFVIRRAGKRAFQRNRLDGNPERVDGAAVIGGCIRRRAPGQQQYKCEQGQASVTDDQHKTSSIGL
jgi:hypothetical protein